MPSKQQKNKSGIEFVCSDGGKVFVLDDDVIKYLPGYATLVQEKVTAFGIAKEQCLVTAIGFPKRCVQFLLDNVVNYTSPQNLNSPSDVNDLCMAAKEMNLLEIKMVLETADFFGCSHFKRAMCLVPKGRAGQYVYMSPNDSQDIIYGKTFTSGITFRFIDEGEIYVYDKNLIKLLPLSHRSISTTCPDWNTPDSQFDFHVKVPFNIKTAKRLFDNVKRYRFPPQAVTRELVDEYYPEAREWSLGDLKDLTEAAIYMETKILEEALLYIAFERLERSGNMRNRIGDEFVDFVRNVNHAFKPSSNEAESNNAENN